MGENNIKRGLPPSVIINAINWKRNQIKSEIDKLKLLDEQMLQLQKKIENSKCSIDSPP